MATVTPAATEIDYPTSDGRPMAETDLHFQEMCDLRDRLTLFFAGRNDVYVSGNLMVYYIEGQPQKFLAPDAFVTFGIRPGRRDWYKSWVEGKLPDVVFEITSKTTASEDIQKKFALYEEVWQVQEYFLFDPRDEYLDPPLLGYRRVRGELVPIKARNGQLQSKQLGLTISRQGTHLVLTDTNTGLELLTRAEAEAQRAEAEAQRATAAEVEVARLQAELAALRKKAGN